jgi:hypothetical protein
MIWQNDQYKPHYLKPQDIERGRTKQIPQHRKQTRWATKTAPKIRG